MIPIKRITDEHRWALRGMGSDRAREIKKRLRKTWPGLSDATLGALTREYIRECERNKRTS